MIIFFLRSFLPFLFTLRPLDPLLRVGERGVSCRFNTRPWTVRAHDMERRASPFSPRIHAYATENVLFPDPFVSRIVTRLINFSAIRFSSSFIFRFLKLSYPMYNLSSHWWRCRRSFDRPGKSIFHVSFRKFLVGSRFINKYGPSNWTKFSVKFLYRFLRGFGSV